MKNNESNSLINFHNLAIELRRLKERSFPISTAALLINQSVNQPIDYSAFLQHPDGQTLSNLCKIICYRFSTDPSSDIVILISLLRFSIGPQQIGPKFLLNTLFSVYHNYINENSLKTLDRFDPIFVEKYLLGKVYSDPKVLFTSTTSELFLPLQIPNLYNISYSERSYNTILQFLIYHLFSRCSAQIDECATNENLFEPFSNFVYQTPDFFIVANQFFKKKHLIEILQKLKIRNPPNLLNSYLSIYQNTSAELVELFYNLYNEDELLKYVSDEHIECLYNFFQMNDKWDSINKLYHRDEDSHSVLTGIFQNSYMKDQRKYLLKYSQLKQNFLIEAIEPILFSDQIKIEPKYYVYLLHNDSVTLRMLQVEPHFLSIAYENSIKRDEVNKKTLSLFISFLNRNLKRFIELQSTSLQNLLFDEDSIVRRIINCNELKFYEIFGGSENLSNLNEALIVLINFTAQSMSQGVQATGPATAPNRPENEVHHRTMKFPSKQFFVKMTEKADVDFVLNHVYKANQELMRITEWRDVLVACPRILFSTIEISSQLQTIADSNQLINLFQLYVLDNYEKFSTKAADFIPLVHFFLNSRLLTVIPQFRYQNLSLSIRLFILECFANCAHSVFTNEPSIDSETIDAFIEFFRIMAETDVFKIASPANDLLCRDFVLPLYRFKEYEQIVPQMMEQLTSLPPQPLTAITATFSENVQPPSVENLQVDAGSEIDEQSFQFIVDFLRNSMPEPELIGQMLQSDATVLKKLSSLAVKALSHADCPLWMDIKFMHSLTSLFQNMRDIELSPRFLQALAFNLDRYSVRGDAANGGGGGAKMNVELSRDLFTCYQVFAELTISNNSFENVLEELLE